MTDIGEALVRQFARQRSVCEKAIAKAMVDEQGEQAAHQSEPMAPSLFKDAHFRRRFSIVGI